MNKKHCRLLLLFILIHSFSYAQISDTKLWAGIALDKKINKKFEATLEFEQRFENNISAFDRLLVQPAIGYKLNKKWSVDLVYRLWYQKEKQNYFFHHRASLGLSYSKKISDLKLKISSKLQYGIPDYLEDDFYISERLISRNSLKLTYTIFGSRFSPYLKYELFTSLQKLEPLNYQWRLTAGTGYYLNKKTSLQVYYALEHEYNISKRKNANIAGITLKHSL